MVNGYRRRRRRACWTTPLCTTRRRPLGVLKKWKGFIFSSGQEFFGREVDRASRTASKGLVLYY